MVYNILSFMVGRSIMTHELPGAAEECGPYLLEQFPALKKIDASKVNTENWLDWLAKHQENFGHTFEVQPMVSSKIGSATPAATLVHAIDRAQKHVKENKRPENL
jgi:hypothetical protein